MAVFFLLVGLEIKREVLDGRLRSAKAMSVAAGIAQPRRVSGEFQFTAA
jgi:Na+/H+ antiporter NhaA